MTDIYLLTYHNAMKKDVKYTYKTSYRINSQVKSILENTFGEVCRKTGLKLSLGKISRAFWIATAEDPALRKQCMRAVCDKILYDTVKKESGKTCRPKRARR